MKKLKKGFAVIAPERRVEIARMGGIAVSRGKDGKARMAAMGRKGGNALHQKYHLVPIKQIPNNT